MESQQGLCCGLIEISGLSQVRDPKDALVTLLSGAYDGFDNDDNGGIFRGAFVLFTGASRNKVRKAAYAERFKKFIEDNGLGNVRSTDPVKNSNSSSFVTLYVWDVNKEKLTAWWNANDPDRVTDDGNEADDDGSW